MASIADDGDDYEVIHANSPLYWSMVDAGLENVGKEDVHKQDEIERSSVAAQLQARACSKKSWWSESLVRFLVSGSPFIFKGSSYTEMRDTNTKVFRTLAKSSLLTEEDALFLQDMMADQDCLGTQTPAFFTRRILAPLIAVSTCLVISVVSLWLPQIPWISLTSNSLLILFFPMLLIQFMAALQSRNAKRKSDVFHGEIQKMLTSSTKMMDVAAKCIRFVQEAELVARGFTFVGSAATARVLNELQVTSRQRQCPDLRQKLFLTSKALFFMLRDSFSQLSNLCPVNVDVSGVMRYCSEIPVSQYPEMLQLCPSNQESVAKLQTMTDGFSIDVLKSMQELNRIHISEFIRRLAVCFVESSKVSDQSVLLSSLLDTMIKDLEKSQRGLLSNLSAHRHGSLKASVCEEKTSAWRPASSASQLRQTYTAVHSLELHLLAALKKIQDISQVMEQKMEADTKPHNIETGDQPTEKDEIEDSSREVWNRMLLLVKSEINACTGCLEESVKRLQKNREEPLSDNPAVRPPPPVSSSSVKVVKVSAQDNPIIVDEVFEAYSEPQECDLWQGQHGFSSPEEEAWQKTQKRNLKMCLGELQSIIDVRAVEREERERIAMDRMKTGTSGGDEHLSVGQHCGQQSEKAGLSETGKTEDHGHVEKYSGEVDSKCSEDLVTDIESRVEFWKQFNQTEHLETVCDEETDRGDSSGSNDKTKESRCCGEALHAEPSDTNNQAGKLVPQESRFFVSDQDSYDKTGTAVSIPDRSDDETEAVHIQKHSAVQKKAQTFSSYQTKDVDTESLSTLSPRKLNTSQDGTNSDSENDSEPRCRTEPESVLEHLSLPAAPSPFAFSIASLVASRAKTFARTEDTFGDSSSDEDNVEEKSEEEK